MVEIGAAAALLSAITQAVAHALLKAGNDKLVVRGLIGLVGVVVMAPVAAFAVMFKCTLTLPHRHSARQVG